MTVLVSWYPFPQHRFWVLSILRPRRLRKKARERDLALALEVATHLEVILDHHPDVSGVEWMSDAEAEAYSL